MYIWFSQIQDGWEDLVCAWLLDLKSLFFSHVLVLRSCRYLSGCTILTSSDFLTDSKLLRKIPLCWSSVYNASLFFSLSHAGSKCIHNEQNSSFQLNVVKPKKFSKLLCSGRLSVSTMCLLLCLRELNFLYQVYLLVYNCCKIISVNNIGTSYISTIRKWSLIGISSAYVSSLFPCYGSNASS